MKRLELHFDRPEELQASRPPEQRGLARDEVRLLVSMSDRTEHARFVDLPRFLTPGTVLVVNASKTMPASLRATHPKIGAFIVNVSTYFGGDLYLVEPRWSAAEPGPLQLVEGDRIDVVGLSAELIAPYPGLPRVWFVRMDGDLHRAMERAGKPIRYHYVEPPYPPLSAYQTLFGRIPGSAEMPSAARPFTPRVVESLRAKGIQIVEVTLHTGVSSLEIEADDIEDQVLLPEPFAVSRETAKVVTAAHRTKRPVVAVGTTVVRALESAWDGERVRASSGFTRLFVHPGRSVHTVDGIITGLHDPMASHLAMLYAIASKEVVQEGYTEAVRERYLWHEFGDSHLILPGEQKRRDTEGRGKWVLGSRRAGKSGRKGRRSARPIQTPSHQVGPHQSNVSRRTLNISHSEQ